MPAAPPRQESTGLFANQPAPTPAPAPAVAPRAQDEFAQFFANPLGASPQPLTPAETTAPPLQSPPQGKPFRGPSNFTMQFGPTGISSPDQQPVRPLNEPGGPASPLTTAFRGSTGIRGPSEFTRVLQGGPGGQSPGYSYAPPPVEQTPLPPPPPKPSSSMLTGILIALASAGVLAMILFAVYIAFGSK